MTLHAVGGASGQSTDVPAYAAARGGQTSWVPWRYLRSM